MEKQLKINNNMFMKKKGYKTIKSYYEVILSKSDVYFNRYYLINIIEFSFYFNFNCYFNLTRHIYMHT